MQVADAPSSGANAGLVARGARHVKVGLALSVVGMLAVFVLSTTLSASDTPVRAADWVAAILSEVVWIAAILSSSRIAQWFVGITGIFCAIAAVVTAVSGLAVSEVSTMTGIPMLPFAGATALVAAGSVLATITPAAQAWHQAQRADRAARRNARSLDDWRGAT